jgi:hypothetical protein
LLVLLRMLFSHAQLLQEAANAVISASHLPTHGCFVCLPETAKRGCSTLDGRLSQTPGDGQQFPSFLSAMHFCEHVTAVTLSISAKCHMTEHMAHSCHAA